MNDLSLIMNRKSVRKYTAEPIPDADLERIVRAGMAAPSAVNLQPWAFVVVNQPEVLKRLGSELPYAKMLLHAPAAIVVCGDTTRQMPDDGNGLLWVMDCSAATENILLAAEALGWGAVWTAVLPDAGRVGTVRTILNLPDSIVPLSVIPLGRPAGAEPAKDKWKPEKVHWNVW